MKKIPFYLAILTGLTTRAMDQKRNPFNENHQKELHQSNLFDVLPNEVLMHILNFLEIDDSYNAALSCKRFTESIKDINKKYTPEQRKLINSYINLISKKFPLELVHQFVVYCNIIKNETPEIVLAKLKKSFFDCISIMTPGNEKELNTLAKFIQRKYKVAEIENINAIESNKNYLEEEKKLIDQYDRLVKYYSEENPLNWKRRLVKLIDHCFEVENHILIKKKVKFLILKKAQMELLTFDNKEQLIIKGYLEKLNKIETRGELFTLVKTFTKDCQALIKENYQLAYNLVSFVGLLFSKVALLENSYINFKITPSYLDNSIDIKLPDKVNDWLQGSQHPGSASKRCIIQ